MAVIKADDIIPPNDVQRLEALRRLKILNTAPEPSFDNITQIMAQVFNAPMSFISLVDKDQVFYKSQVGPFGRNAVLRKDSLCSYTILSNEPLVIEDASVEACFQDNPYVAASGGLRFYAGAPLVTKEGHQIGTICIVDTKIRTFSDADKSLLMRFAQMVMHEIELRYVALLEGEAEVELLKNRERFELVTKATHDAVWDWNLQTDEIWWNEGFKELFGYAEEEIEPTIVSWYNRVHPDDTDRVIGGIHAVIDKGGKNWSDEYRFRRKDGSYAIVLDRGYALHDENGQPYRMLGSMQDITHRKEAEAMAVNQAHVIQTIANNTTSTLFMMDKEGYCTFINATGEHMLGYNLEELRQKPMHDLIHHHHPDGTPYPRESCPLENALSNNLPMQTQRELFFRKDGSSFPASCSASPIFEKDVLVSAVIEIRDITLEIEAEQLLRRSATELEQKVQERTIELEKRNNELEQFTYVSHHDLQEPLRKIVMFTDLVKEEAQEKLSEVSQLRLKKVSDAAHRMSRALRDVLDFASLSKEEQLVPVNLNEVLAEVQSDLELVISEKKAIITCNALPIIKGVSNQMHQLLYNLLNNALKFSKPEEPPRISISCRELYDKQLAEYKHIDQNRNYFLITIQDNGIGFRQDQADKIFNMFQRLHNREAFEGTGIGLAQCKKVVQNHGGKIWGESMPNAGATFKVLLPIT